MEYILCILTSVFLSTLYTNLTINKYDKIITEHVKNTSDVTFNAVLELLKKVGVIKE